MELLMELNGRQFRVNLNEPFDCSVAISTSGITAWGLNLATIAAHREGDFTGSVQAGSPVNFNDISFNPHAHGTHTECMGHITERVYSINETLPLPLMPVALITVTPAQVGEDLVIGLEQIQAVLPQETVPAVMIRTRTTRVSNVDWSDSNPAYMDARATRWLAEIGILHLLLDLPSVDREQDGGALTAHKAFWGLPDNPRANATITELISVPGQLMDGLYLMNLQIAPFENDASPSRPVLFELVPCEP